MTVLLALACAVLALAWWYKAGERDRAIQRELRIKECEQLGHAIKRIHAWDDPRWPVDQCTRCKRQWPVRFPCPHCGEELGIDGWRNGTSTGTD